MDDNITSVTVDGEIHYCAAHPERDTELRCNRCDRYMCVDCAKRTAGGLHLQRVRPQPRG